MIHELQQNLIAAAAKEYRAIFTRQEIMDMHAFYMSPSGKSAMAKTPVLMQRLTPLFLTQSEQVERFVRKNVKDIIAESLKRSGVSM